MEPSSRMVRGAHGLRLHCLEWSLHGEPLLLLHGFGHSARVWDPFVPDLAPHFRVLALDARGHGDSDHDAEYRYHHASVAADIEAALDDLELDRAILVAHSMSGYAAIRLAARQPQRVSRLVLVDAGAELSASVQRIGEREPPDSSYPNAETYARVLARSHPQTEPATLLRLARHWLRRGEDGQLVPKLDPAFLRPRDRDDVPANKRNFDRARWAQQETERLWGYLARIRCPTLVVRGEASPMLSSATLDRMVNEVMSDASQVTLAGAGHAVPLDAPDALRRALRDFLL